MLHFKFMLSLSFVKKVGQYMLGMKFDFQRLESGKFEHTFQQTQTKDSPEIILKSTLYWIKNFGIKNETV